MTKTETHQVRGWGHWWRSQEELDEYSRDQTFKRRARAAGYHSEQEMEEFRKRENRATESLDKVRNRERWIQAEMNRLKLKHGLGAQANRSHLKAAGERTGDPEIRFLFGVMTTATMNDTQKLNEIRQLFLDGKPPAEILYTTAMICDVKLRRKQ